MARWSSRLCAAHPKRSQPRLKLRSSQQPKRQAGGSSGCQSSEHKEGVSDGLRASASEPGLRQPKGGGAKPKRRAKPRNRSRIWTQEGSCFCCCCPGKDHRRPLHPFPSGQPMGRLGGWGETPSCSPCGSSQIDSSHSYRLPALIPPAFRGRRHDQA